MTSVIRIVLSLLLVLASSSIEVALAQTPTPTFSTTPTPPPANQPFSAVYSMVTNPGSIGLWPNTHIQISGNVITIPFDLGCGFICPGGGSGAFRSFPFTMPALAAGTYQVRFVEGSTLLAEFSLIVGVTSIPTGSPISLALMTCMLLLLASRFSRVLKK